MPNRGTIRGKSRSAHMTSRCGPILYAAIVAAVLGSALFVRALGVSATSSTAQSTPSVKPEMRVTLVGTGGGPGVNLQRFGISTLVEAGSTRLDRKSTR